MQANSSSESPEWTPTYGSQIDGMYVGVTRGAQVTGVAVASLFLTWLSFTSRMYVRGILLKFMGKEDWLTVATMAIFTIFVSLCLRETVYGLGAHMENISPPSLVAGFKMIFVCELLYVVSTTITKLSIASYFLRLSSKRYQRMVIYITTTAVLVFSTAYFFFLIFQCTPISHLWAKYLVRKSGKCLSADVLAAVTYAHCAMSAITDWIFGILPIFFVWNMQMNPRTKWSVVLILSLGFFASTATIVRIYYIKRLEATTDYSWEGINLVKWSMIEPAIAITAMNFATLRPLFKNILLRFDNTPDSTDDKEMNRSSVESRVGLRARNSVSAKEYSAEFAEFLGLSRVGVTTHISADRPEKGQLVRRLTSKIGAVGIGRGPGTGVSKLKAVNESQTELYDVSGQPSPLSEAGDLGVGKEVEVNWLRGIKATTTVTYDVS